MNQPHSLYTRTVQYFQRQPLDAVVFAHLVLSVFFFSHYFLFNYILMADTDIYLVDMSEFMLDRKDFLSGTWSLWNPHLMAGIPAYYYPNAAIWSPDHWLLFLLPENYFLLGFTFLSFIKLWLCGVIAFHLFKEEIRDNRWAFFSSVTFQLCGYTLWWAEKPDVFNMWLLTLLATYLIWTLHKRPAYKSFLYLTLTLSGFLLPGHTAISCYMIALLTLLFLYRMVCLWENTAPLKEISIFVFSVGVSLLVFSLRLIPVMMEAAGTDRGHPPLWDLRELSFLGLRLFNPEILGVNQVNSLQLTSVLGGAFSDVHIHWAMPHYFGVIPALLVLWALLTPEWGKKLFWSIYTFIFLAIAINLEPFDGILRTFMHPAYHFLSIHIFLPVGFSMLAGLAGRSLEKDLKENPIQKHTLLVFLIVLAIIALHFLQVWVPVIPSLHSVVKVMVIVFLATTMGGLLAIKSGKPWAFSTTLSPGIIKFLMLLAPLVLLFPLPLQEVSISHSKMMLASLLMIEWALAWTLTRGAGPEIRSWLEKVFWPYCLIFALVLVVPWVNEVRQIPSLKESLLLAMAGSLKFFMLAGIFVFVLVQLGRKSFPTVYVFPLFLFLLIFDLLPASKIHSHISTNPFYKYADLYPDEDHLALGALDLSTQDKQNYRFNHPHQMIRTPYYTSIYGKSEAMGSFFSLYDLRTYGGYANARSQRYQKFIENFLVPQKQVGLYTNVKKEDRFLDLLSVRYDFDTDLNRPVTRPSALSRFMLFSSYEVVEDESQILKRLREPDFNPKQFLLLNQAVAHSPKPSPATPLTAHEKNPDHIELNINSRDPGLILFNDTFHEGWKAWVDGQRQDILHANYNFMAVSVTSGFHQIVFKFEPAASDLAKKLAGLGVGLAILLYGFFYLLRRKLGEDELFPPSKQSLMETLTTHIHSLRFSYLTLTALSVIAFLQAILNTHHLF